MKKLLIVLVALVFSTTLAFAQATFVVAFQGGQIVTAATVSGTFTSQTAGKTLLAVVTWDPVQPAPTGVVTSGGDALTQTAAGVISTADGVFKYATYLLPTSIATATGVTATWASAPVYSDISGWIFTGIASPTVDIYTANAGTGTAASVTSGTLGAANEFAGAVCFSGGETLSGGGTGFTFDGETGASNTGTGYSHATPTATTSLVPTFTLFASTQWNALIVTIKAGSAPPAGGTYRALTGYGK